MPDASHAVPKPSRPLYTGYETSADLHLIARRLIYRLKKWDSRLRGLSLRDADFSSASSARSAALRAAETAAEHCSEGRILAAGMALGLAQGILLGGEILSLAMIQHEFDPDDPDLALA